MQSESPRRRLTYSHRSSQSPTSIVDRITSEQLDVWEHAALLYHGLDWNNAAEVFTQLSVHINDVEAATLCALNASMIQATLGEFELAAAMVEQAARMDQNLILTPYIMGIIDWELARFIKAEACLDVSLRAMHGGDISFADLGLDFVLCSKTVRRQLTALKVDAAGRFGPPRAIGPVIPAESIFEAPPRSKSRSRSMLTPRMSPEPVQMEAKQTYIEDRVRRQFDVRETARLPQSRPSKGGELSPSSRSPAGRSVRKPSPLRIIKQRFTSRSTEAIIRGSADTPQVSHSSPSTTPRPSADTWPFKSPKISGPDHKKTPWTARDAHGEYESVRELASFIRKAHDKKTGAIAVLQPRDATANAASTKELAKFLKHAGKSRPLMPEPDVDLFHDHEDGIGDTASQSRSNVNNERGSGSMRSGPIARVRNSTRTALRSSSPTTPLPTLKQSPNQAGTPVQTASPSLTPAGSHKPHAQPNNADSFGILPSTTYQPRNGNECKILPPVTPLPMPPPARPPEAKVLTPPVSPPLKRRYPPPPPPWNIHTAASSTSSLYAESMMTVERQQVARDAALRMLEGRERPAKQRGGIGRKATKIARLSNKWKKRPGRMGDEVADPMTRQNNGDWMGGRPLSIAEEVTKMDSFAIIGLGGGREHTPEGGAMNPLGRIIDGEGERTVTGVKKLKEKWGRR